MDFTMFDTNYKSGFFYKTAMLSYPVKFDYIQCLISILKMPSFAYSYLTLTYPRPSQNIDEYTKKSVIFFEDKHCFC